MSSTGAERVRGGSQMFSAWRRELLARLLPEGPHDLRARLFLQMYGADFESREREAIVRFLREWDRAHPDARLTLE